MTQVQTIDETRRRRLELLIQEYGSIAALNVAMDMARTDATFSQIRNQAVHSTTGKPRGMGDDLARKIEKTLRLERGWMDTPPGDEWLQNDNIRELIGVAQILAPYQIAQLIAIGSTLAKIPAPHLVTDEVTADEPERPAIVEDAKAPPGRGAGPVSVRGVMAKKIGKGYFGPPADGPDGDRSASSQGNRSLPRKGHARRGQ